MAPELKMTEILDELMPFLEAVDQGYVPTEEETCLLSQITKLNKGFRSMISAIPESIRLLTNLQELDLWSTQVSDLKPLSGLTNLQELDLSFTQVSDLKPLSGLTNLQELELNGTQVSDLHPLSALTNLQELYLRNTHVSDLQPLSGLTNLQGLDLSDTQVSDLQPLSGLTNLQELDLFGTQVSDLKPLSGLTNLQELYLRDTHVSDLQPLSGLDNLQELYLRNTQVSDLKPLSGLANLQRLVLSHTQVSDLKPLSGLANLQELDLSGTQVSDLTPLQSMTQLESLRLSFIPELRSIPGWIGDFQNLNDLNLSYLELDALPKELLQLNPDFNSDLFGKGIHLKGTTLSKQPISLFFQPREMIEEYFDAPKVAVNEAKVIFLGNGAAGKTYTVCRLNNGGEDKDFQTKTTHGIQITPISGTKTDGTSFTVNCWDFGGQEIMHSMHRCFLTDRTCYVVVVSNREDPNRQARYWLKTIAEYAKKAPVLLAVNRWDNILGAGIDMNRLVQEFPNLIPEPIYYQAKGGDAKEFNEKFTAAILRQAEKLDSVSLEFPEQWEAIRQDIRSKAAENRYISKADYHDICSEHGMENEDIRRWLLEWFNDLGVCFSYHQDGKKELEDYKVLDPAWLTNGIYILINSGRKFGPRGVITKEAINVLLSLKKYAVQKEMEYEEEDTDYILAVMRKFMLSYSINADEEFIPSLCAEETPKDLHPETSKYHISYRIHYSYLPDNVLHRLMIEYYHELDKERLWRKGMCVGARHLEIQAVVELRDDTDLLIDVYSNGDVMPWSMLNELRKSVYKINKDMSLNAEDYVVFRHDGATFSQSVSSLLDATQQGIRELHFYPETTRKWFSKHVNELLGMAMKESTLRSIEKMAREKEIPYSQVIHNYGTLIMGDQNNTENHTESDELVKLVEKLINSQIDQNRELLDKLVKALNGTGDSRAKALATEMEQDFKSGKKNFLQKILDYLKPVGEIVDTTKSMAENLPAVIKAIATVLKTAAIAAQVIF